PRMFAILSTAWVVPGIAGPALAAFVADHVGWRPVFLGLLPLVLVAGSLALRALRSVPANPERVARRVLLDAVRVASGTGLALTAGTIAWTTGAWIQERTVFRVGAAPLVRNGFLLVAIGIAAMGLVLNYGVPAWLSVPAWGIAGLGIGMAYSSISLTVLRHAPAGSEGAAASSMQLADILGNALGTGLGAVAVASAVAASGSAMVGVALTDGIAGALA